MQQHHLATAIVVAVIVSLLLAIDSTVDREHGLCRLARTANTLVDAVSYGAGSSKQAKQDADRVDEEERLVGWVSFLLLITTMACGHCRVLLLLFALRRRF
jgi:hypothetical protein